MKPTMKTMYSFLAPVLRSLLVASITLVGFSASAQEAAIRKNLAERLPNLAGLVEAPGGHELINSYDGSWPTIAAAVARFAAAVAVQAPDVSSHTTIQPTNQ